MTSRAKDDTGAVTTSAPITVTVNPNTPPTVTLTAPDTTAKFIGPATVPLAATASDSDGTIRQVAFYRDETLIGYKTVAPYEYSWTKVAPGTYNVTARATDDKGTVTSSPPITVTVNPNTLPTVTLTAPDATAKFIGPATVPLAASASDSDGTIKQVSFYRDGTLIGSKTAAPYAYSWTNVAPGTYNVTATATDDKGGVSSSSPLTVTVNPNTPPTVTLTAPDATAKFIGPATVPLAATASDSDGTIKQVAFYRDETLIGYKTVAPYTYS